MEGTLPRPAPARANAAGLLWLIQAISGLLLVLLLAVHMVANHFVLPQGLANYRDVINYIANPLIFALETVFLIVVTGHALLGVRSVIFDTGLSDRGQRTVNVVLVVLGCALVAYGLWLTITIVNR